MKIWVICDLEGVATISSFDHQCQFDGRYYEQSKRLATYELNALVEGALAGGATEIVIADGHGAGGLEPELLHPEAKLAMRWGLKHMPWGLDDTYDALMLFGHHAMMGAPNSVLCHSWTHIDVAECRLNGRPIGEIGANCLMAGYFGIPAIFVTGDLAAVKEAQDWVPGIEGAAVKEGLPTGAAVSLSPAKAQELIRAGAERAMGKVGEIAPLTTPGPYEFTIELMHMPLADRFESLPGWKRVNRHVVSYTGDDYLECMAKWWA
jgi:D-amino peptidase